MRAGRVAVLSSCVLVAVTALAPTAAAADPPVAQDVPVASLPAGPAPRMLHVDVAEKAIVDGARRVSIAGLQATVVQVHKVVGGYLLGRRIADDRYDLVHVAYSGKRTIVVRDWYTQRFRDLYPSVNVAGSAKQIIVNTGRSTSDDYRDTRTVALPSGTVTHRRTFSAPPLLMAFGNARALMGVGQTRVLTWTPDTNAISTIEANASGEAADLTAGQMATRPDNQPGQTRVYSVRPIDAPTTGWPVPQEDWNFGYWSPDDSKIVSTTEITDERGGSTTLVVHAATDGTRLFSMRIPTSVQVAWENNTTLIFKSVGEAASKPYRLVRCDITADDSCERIGATSDKYGGYVLATRRNA